MQPKLFITILALAFLNADTASARYTLGEAVDAASRTRNEFYSGTEEVDAAVASAPNTLEDAVDAASNRKPLGSESKTKDSGIQSVTDGMGQNVPSSNKPQTLGEAMAATESKRMNVNAGGLRADIVDRKFPTLINDKDSLMSMKETEHAQSIKIEINEESNNSEGRGYNWTVASFERRVDGTSSTSGDVIVAMSGGASMIASLAAIGIFVAQLW
eukprot:CAMPEP_0197274584 /NCGR_PEP_ID=MMETSP1432-20130617/12889_1 /TAXON_ID=44447 /ORGANISM="Pseudo-nitzschia delicatissima, Strain UNC1205" /LENGTH=214 /DNA_ID=CAMNT_0042740395 /DNA_START=52 /DNA_END=696 /DNA_ORIENTATION=+